MLMVVSYVAQITLISLLFDALYNDQKSMLELFIIISVIVLIVSLVSQNRYILTRFDKLTEHFLEKRMKDIRGHNIDKILNLSSDFSIYELVIDAQSPLCNQTLRQANLKKNFIQILKIDRVTEVVDFPSADTTIQQGDRMVVYGKISAISQFILNSEAQ